MATDIAISFDTTGSMFPALHAVRRNVTELINNLFETVPDLRMSVIAHGDYCDTSTYVTKVFQFSSNRTDLVHFVENVGRTGGGDSDECYEEVFRIVHQELDWRTESNKAFVFIADASPHEVGYRYGKVTVTIDWRRQLQNIQAAGIKTYAVQCLKSRYDSRNNRFYDQIGAMNGNMKFDLAQFSDIPQVLTAVTFAQYDLNQVEVYANELQSAGLFNRNLRQIFDQVTGKHVTFAPIKRDDGLVPVAPDRFQILNVDKDTDIKSFVLSTGADFKTGRGFYELTKMEDIQERKEIILVEKATGDMFSGSEARDLLGLPYGERGRKTRHDVPRGYVAYVQSTSNNRKLIGGTKFLYEAV